MLLKDIADLLIEEARNAHVINDERIDPRLLRDFIMLKRATFIKTHLNDRQFVELNTLQTEYLTLSAYDSSLERTGTDALSLGNLILRTAEVPKMIEYRIGPAVYEISLPDILSKTIQYVPFDRLRWCGNGVVNKHMLFAAFYDNRFYVKSNSEIEKPLKYLILTAIFADPTEVSTFDETTDDYPVNLHMIEYMKNAIIKTDIRNILETRSDEKNDSSGLIE
jgi:hypothetical protein